jgi:hypothetical protein
MGMMATSSQSIINVWDYESFKLMYCMSNDKVDILSIDFLDPYKLLISLDN